MTWRPLSIIPVWVGVVAAIILVGFLVPAADRLAWLGVVLGAATLITFALQLALQEKDGLVTRVMLSVGGSVILLAVATAVFAVMAGIG
ncbi:MULTISPECIES: hypothetical protein [unclassified Diaminobutyricimonas]|uniref:hypothetical protein n=1 Tax=unclassified Diaminobutyricimonas TaxID=2643261 RepID=UPI0012F4E2A2|nr:MULTISPECIES: hypothetical protein [unclassified Diaminobutyricimonas]